MPNVLQISAVGYVNTLPYIYGLEQNDLQSNRWEVSRDTPAECAVKLRDGRVDVGLVPVAALPNLTGYRPITNWGIAADGEVYSVLLLSHVPIDKIKTMFLDYQSETSNALLQILLREHFELEPLLLDSKPGYEQLIEGDVAGLVIGDRALMVRDQYPYQYDLALHWKQLTGLPFIFAHWVGSDHVSSSDEQALSIAFEEGMSYRDHLANDLRSKYPHLQIEQYLKDYIHYELSTPYWDGLALFREKQARWILNSTI